ncbi:dihydroxyacetone kinase phosphoryl donor subunit DhaM [Arcanobacterium phocae]|uniref:dihydroxyacetone kinase phosphoryl donor subunit DhaM n=1 Tax=Arcanobacterium phocae TaxID=131112 RepID=UPI001C0ED39A|nr:dihydroxyacetone kinase phosphoryl donor subunit DhaM [Arcanobacterium phocae]
MSVGIVLVSHSIQLAQATVELIGQIQSDKPATVAIAAGSADGGFGTDAMAIMNAIEEVQSGNGVVVLTDLGSAILSADMALEFLGYPDDVVMVGAPFVEGALAATITASNGGALADVAQQARTALDAKRRHIDGEPASEIGVAPQQPSADTSFHQLRVVNAAGLHARPAARVAHLASQYDAEITVIYQGEHAAATSAMALAGLGTQAGDLIELQASGRQASEALVALTALIESGFGED